MLVITLETMGATTAIFTTNPINIRTTTKWQTAKICMRATVQPVFTTNSIRHRTATIASIVSLAASCSIRTLVQPIWAINHLNHLNCIFYWCLCILHSVLRVKLGHLKLKRNKSCERRAQLACGGTKNCTIPYGTLRTYCSIPYTGAKVI